MKKSKDKRVATLAGAIAGGIEATSVWPSEYVKTQLQFGGTRFRGPIDCALQTVRQHGFLALYRGLPPVLVFSIPKAGVRFGAFETIRAMVPSTGSSATDNLRAGLLAGALEATLVTTPQETLKVRLIDANKGMVRGTIDILRREGIAGAYKGLLPTVLKQASNQGVRFLVYGEIMVALKRDLEAPTKPWQAVVGGMLAGSVSTFGARGELGRGRASPPHRPAQRTTR